MFILKDSQWKGKRIAFLGDSITEGIGVNSGECFWNYLEGKLGCVSYSFGKSGAVFRELSLQVDIMHEKCGDKLDAVVVFAGTNDYNDGISIGKWYTAPYDCNVIIGYESNMPVYSVRKRREFNTDVATFRGSINAVMQKLRNYYPALQIIVMTPIHRAYANYGGNNIQYDEMHSDKGGYYFDEYVKVIKEIPFIWACDLIDLHSKSGLFPLNDMQAVKFFCDKDTDRLHPNAKGHRRIAEVMEVAMMNIPCFSEH